MTPCPFPAKERIGRVPPVPLPVFFFSSGKIGAVSDSFQTYMEVWGSPPARQLFGDAHVHRNNAVPESIVLEDNVCHALSQRASVSFTPCKSGWVFSNPIRYVCTLD